jgi:excisionase family DNA binding protein
MASLTEDQLFLTKDEVCGILRISLSTLNRWMKDKVIPYCKIGGRVLVPTHEVLKFSTPCQSEGGDK